MRPAPLAVIGVLALASSAALAAPPAALHLAYDTYATGLQVAEVQAAFALGPDAYQIQIAYHTTGLIGFFFRGHQRDSVDGVWQGDRPAPHEFEGTGVWRGHNRMTVIDYPDGEPTIRDLVPPNANERQPVPPALRAHSMDTLSALALLIRRVADTSHCDVAVHTFDGRRATEIAAHTVGWEMLGRTSRSIFSGPALRCDFDGRMLAGFKLGDDRQADRKPLHGSAWFAAVVPGEPPLPVRMQFQTRWFGEATMYLTAIRPGEPPPQVAEH